MSKKRKVATDFIHKMDQIKSDIVQEVEKLVDQLKPTAMASEAPQPKFSKSQQEAHDAAVIKRLNILATGPAGTGKSYLFGFIYDALVALGLEVSRVASTGIAAVNVQGTTWHAFMGIGLAKDSVAELVIKIQKNEDLNDALTECDVLMIDEISMVDPLYFAKCDQVLKMIRGSNKPFGGIQMIAFGDFLQLPPVSKDNQHDDDDDAVLPSHRKRLRHEPEQQRFHQPVQTTQKKIDFVFELKLWNDTFQETIELDTIFRQTDNAFRSLLNRARIGQLNLEDETILKSRVGAPVLNPVRLRSYKKHVEALNTVHINNIKSPEVIFYSSKGYKWKNPAHQSHDLSPYQESLIQRLVKDCPAPAYQKLKIGARVMFLWNEDVELGLVNGALGEIVAFLQEESPSFQGDTRKYNLPQVKFDRDGSIHTVKPHRFIAKDRNLGEAWTFRTPLKVAASMTIHKSQGMTLDQEETSLGDSIFEFGQSYVAISRCTTLEGLSLSDFDPQSFKAHPKALMFYKRLRDKKKASR